jgi:hypothetical protein
MQKITRQVYESRLQCKRNSSNGSSLETEHLENYSAKTDVAFIVEKPVRKITNFMILALASQWKLHLATVFLTVQDQEGLTLSQSKRAEMAFAYNSFRRIKSAEGSLEQLREEDKYYLDMWVTEALILVGLLISPLSTFQKLINREKKTQEAAYYLHLIVQFNQECSFFERLDEQTSHWTPRCPTREQGR